MVINKTGGNKTKKISRSVSTKFLPVDKIDPGQMFAQIVGSQGECRFRVICSDGVTRLGKLSGYMKKGPRISSGSYVVVSLREFEQEHKNCDIISYGNPPHHIISIFKKNDVKLPTDDIEFEESEDEFADLDQSVNRKFDLPPTYSDEEEVENNNYNKQDVNKVDKIVINGKNKSKDNSKNNIDSDEEEEEEIDWNDL
jgi:initiation factor 1A